MSLTLVSVRAHRHGSFAGRVPDEDHRSATPPELLYDRTFVVVFETAANEFARYVADGPGLGRDPWVRLRRVRGRLGVDQRPWFASAYDTGDWRRGGRQSVRRRRCRQGRSRTLARPCNRS